MIRRDDFDSETLGKRCGIVQGAYEKKELKKWDHVRVVVPMDERWGGHYASYHEDGYRLTSVRGTFEGTVLAMGGYRVPRAPTDDELVQILDAAPELFVHSRFHQDPFYLVDDVVRIHERWLKRLASDRCLYVIGHLGAPSAFVGFSRHTHDGRPTLDIELIAALGQRGAARELLNALVQEQRCHHVSAKTQLSNLPAVNLYHALGMRLVRTEAIFAWSRS